MAHDPIRILIVDDSAVIRSQIAAALESDRELTVVSTAMNTAIATHKIQRDQPDVVLLDLNLSGSSGLALLRAMPVANLPTVVFTNYSPSDSEEAAEAIAAGAIAVIAKPNGENLQETLAELRLALKGAGKASRRRRQAATAQVANAELEAAGVSVAQHARHDGSFVLAPRRSFGRPSTGALIAIGASTGGTDAIRDVLMGLPADCPPVVAVIHMPNMFTSGFARRLNQLCPMRVEEAVDGQELQQGLVLIAPGDRHMVLRSGRGGGYSVALIDAAPVMRHRPSVDVLFESVAVAAGAHSMGILLTGMGADGAKGLLSIRQQGGHTVCQSERSCVVFGMPARGIDLGAADTVADLESIPNACINWMRRA